MGVDHAPLSVFFPEDHGRARYKLRIVVIYVARWWLVAGPLPTRLAMTPDDSKTIGNRAANVVGRPISGLNVLAVKLPKPNPVFAAMVGVTVQIEISRFGCWTKDWLKVLPIKPGI